MKILFTFIITILPGLAAASSAAHLDHLTIDLTNREAIRNGAKAFTSYCLNCHSASLMRFNRLARDLELTEEQVFKDYMFVSHKIGDTMSAAIDAKDAKAWFGTKPPDLSVIARARGTDWLYSYLRSFYLDEKRPTGVNNQVFKDVAMPHVLWELQGLQKAVYKTVKQADGSEHEVFDHFELVQKGKLTSDEYDSYVADLVHYLAYMGEPSKMQRLALGKWVLLYLLIFAIVAYFLKREFWKDVKK